MAVVWSITTGSFPTGLTMASSGLLTGVTSQNGLYPLSLNYNTSGTINVNVDTVVAVGYYAGCVGAWLLAEGSGSVAHDTSGNYNQGNLVATYVWSSGNITFSSGGYMNVARNNTALDLTGSFSIAVAVTIGTLQSGTIVSKTNAGTNGYEISMSSGVVTFSIFSGTGSTTDPYFSISSGVLLASTRYIVGVYNKGVKAYLYVNGALVATSANNPAASVIVDPSDLFVGARGPSGGTPKLNAELNGLIVYNRALNAGEVAKMFSDFSL